MKRMYLFGLLDTPRYHLMMAVIALVVLVIVISAWVHTYKTLTRQQRILAALARELCTIDSLRKAANTLDNASSGIVNEHAA